jgi:hypothetical protein
MARDSSNGGVGNVDGEFKWFLNRIKHFPDESVCMIWNERYINMSLYFFGALFRYTINKTFTLDVHLDMNGSCKWNA